MQSRVIAAALLAAAVGTAANLAAAAPINCKASTYNVEQAVCSDRVLLALDRDISDRLDTLKQQCPAAQKLLVLGQKFWLRERWNCRNAEVASDTTQLNACLAGSMDRRLRQLNAVGGECDLAPLAASYRFVDVDYLMRFSEHYVGKQVSVFGQMAMAACHGGTASPTAATIIGKNLKRDRFRVQFSTMPAREHEWLCAQAPMAHWEGTIERDSKGTFLLLTDVLGQKLP